MKRPLLAALFVLGAACHSPAGPATLGPLKIVAQDGALHLENVYSTIGGYAPGRTEAIVWWWRAVPGPADAPVPGAVAAIVVHL